MNSNFHPKKQIETIREESYIWFSSDYMKQKLNLRKIPENFISLWETLEVDKYLRDGQDFRLRRYGLFSFDAQKDLINEVPNAYFYQSKKQNNYAGGIKRVFPKLDLDDESKSLLYEIIRFDFDTINDTKNSRYMVGVHQIRIKADLNKEVSPAPEGIHTDGHDYVAIHLIKRKNIYGGGCSIYDQEESYITSKMLYRLFDSIIINDKYYKHGISAITQDPDREQGFRDVLILDFNVELGFGRKLYLIIKNIMLLRILQTSSITAFFSYCLRLKTKIGKKLRLKRT